MGIPIDKAAPLLFPLFGRRLGGLDGVNKLCKASIMRAIQSTEG
jgi:hypothetical protein